MIFQNSYCFLCLFSIPKPSNWKEQSITITVVIQSCNFGIISGLFLFSDVCIQNLTSSHGIFLSFNHSLLSVLHFFFFFLAMSWLLYPVMLECGKFLRYSELLWFLPVSTFIVSFFRHIRYKHLILPSSLI